MEQENIKLAKIKKSCKAVKIFSKVVSMLCIVCSGIALLSAFIVFAQAKNLEPELEKQVDCGEISVVQNIGGLQFHVLHMDSSILDKEEIHIDSSIPALEEALNRYPRSYMVAGYCLIMAVMVGLLGFAMHQVASAFKKIEEQDSPFGKDVIKHLLVMMIIISVCIGLTVGLGFGVLGGLITWAVYTIMDYGRVLQQQSDETL